MAKSAAPIRSLTIFLMKAGIKESDALDDEAWVDGEEVDIHLGGKSIGTLYAKQTPITPPSWLKFFAGVTSVIIEVVTRFSFPSSCRAF